MARPTKQQAPVSSKLDRAPDPFEKMIVVRLRGVTGPRQETADSTIQDTYTREREACEAGIRAALAELDEAGGHADAKSDEFDLAWAWHKVDEAYCALAHLESRHKLAGRREAIRLERLDKAAKRAEADKDTRRKAEAAVERVAVAFDEVP